MMISRVSKDPDVRKKELLDTAERLFEEKGYESTSVSDIVKTVGVAQGTFYYYFKTKEDIVDALTERYARMVSTVFEEVVNENGPTALEKLQRIFQHFLEYGKERKRMIEFIHEEKNILLHHKLEAHSTKSLTPSIVKMIEQGIEEGSFDVEHLEEAALSMMAVNAWLLDKDALGKIYIGEFDERYFGYLDMMERILGTKKGAIRGLNLLKE